MNLIKLIFGSLTVLLSVYSILCTIRILLSWVPAISNSFTRFISSICDPYLNFFSRRGILRFGSLDFSPFLSLAILGFLTTFCSSISMSVALTFAEVLSKLVYTLWGVISSILGFFIVFFAIRFIVYLVMKNSYTTTSSAGIWKQIDYIINPIIYKIADFFSHGKMLSYKATMLISIVSFIVVKFSGDYFIDMLCKLIKQIPF